jgi:eukaryotic-like serine/threonine-protein kinase
MMGVGGTPVAHVGGRYALYAEIASGGMATVHIGRLMGTAGFSRTVAIKRLLPQLARDPDFVAMFMDEARVAARIRHPNVVPTLDVLAADGQLLLVMEYVHGESLGRLLRALRAEKKRVPPSIASAILCGVLHGLHAAHEAKSEDGEPLGIVHRDVSPQNVLVGIDGVARVLDFGIAKAAGRVQTTREGNVKGKFAYMAPEQMGGGTVGRAADVYAASVVLWETLTGERLFDADTEGQLAIRVMQGATRPPSSIAKEVSSALDAVVLRGLAVDPNVRYATARDMGTALEKACPPATAMAVGAWVESVAAVGLSARARAVTEIEKQSSLRPMDAAQIMSQLDTPPLPGDRPAPPPIDLGAIARTAPPEPLPAPGRLPRSLFDANPATPLGASTTAPSAKRRSSRAGAVVALIAGALTLAAAAGVGLFLLRRADSGAAAINAPGSSAPSASPPASSSGYGAGSSAAAAPPALATCPQGMARIPGGKFFMGADDGSSDEKPAHKVALSPYCLDQYEVTTADYKKCSDSGDCKRAGTTNDWDGITAKERQAYDTLCNIRDIDGKAKHPINCVDWEMANDYCHAMGARLPTEAEWEFAARGPDGRKYPWGDEEPSEKLMNGCGPECVAWGKEHGIKLMPMYKTSDGFPASAPIGSFPEGRSRYGVYDIVGNVWEWVGDWHGSYADAPKSDTPPMNPEGPKSGKTRVVRGGGFGNSESACVRPSFRFHEPPVQRTYSTGFRCAKSL